MTEMFGEAWPPMVVPDLAPDDDDDDIPRNILSFYQILQRSKFISMPFVFFLSLICSVSKALH